MIVRMDLEPFHRGVYQIVLSVTAFVSSALFFDVPRNTEIPLKSPVSVESALIQTSPASNFETIPTYSILNDVEMPEVEKKEITPNSGSVSQFDSLASEKSGRILSQSEPSLNNRETKLSVTSSPAPVVTATPTPTSTPTPTPSPSPSSSAAPSIKPIPTKPPKATAEAGLKKTRIETDSKPELQIPPASSIKAQKSLSPDTLLSLINNHRAEINLPPVEKDPQLCQLAAFRGPQLHEEIYGTGKVHQGLYELNLPYWITENMASYPSEQQVFKWWMNSKIHRKAIEGNYKYSCGVCSGNSCAQLFTNYTPKS